MIQKIKFYCPYLFWQYYSLVKKNSEFLQEETKVVDQEESISLETAKELAISYSDRVFENVLNKEASAVISTNENIKNTEIANNVTSNRNLFYVINLNPSGFVIVSATNKIEPILAYSETGYFDLKNAMYGVKDWIDGISDKINYYIEMDVEPDSTTIKEWDNITTFSAPPNDEEIIVVGPTIHELQGPYLTTSWGQGVGYNDAIPGNYGCVLYSNGKPPIGCVATAIGQIINYWRYPSTFDWNNMPSTGGGGAIPNLLYTIAEMVDMSYSCSGSGATSSSARNAFVTLGYTSSSLSTYNENTVAQQLNNKKPVMLFGTDSSIGAGHAWVCDGYKRDVYTLIHNPNTIYEYETYTYGYYYFYMNWGWGSELYNGYYRSYQFNTSNGKFNDNVYMISNIYH
ncbi:C10 family peptidase [Sphingobacterium hungaricum]